MIASGSLLLYPALPPRGEFSLSGRVTLLRLERYLPADLGDITSDEL